VGELPAGPPAERLAGLSLSRLEQGVARLIARSGDDPVDAQQHGAVVEPQRTLAST